MGGSKRGGPREGGRAGLHLQQPERAHRLGLEHQDRPVSCRGAGLRPGRSRRDRRPPGEHPVDQRWLVRVDGGEPGRLLPLVDLDQAVGIGQPGDLPGGEGGQQPLHGPPAGQFVRRQPRPDARGDQVVDVLAEGARHGVHPGTQVGGDGAPRGEDRHRHHRAVQQRGRLHPDPASADPGRRFARERQRAHRLERGHGRGLVGRPGQVDGAQRPGAVGQGLGARLEALAHGDAQVGQPLEGALPLRRFRAAAGDDPPAQGLGPFGQTPSVRTPSSGSRSASDHQPTTR